MLQNRLNLNNASVLDLFAGSGSLGFEALSRGASMVVFVDATARVLDVLERNAISLGCLDTCEIIQADANEYISKARDQFDLIFADPPYAYDITTNIPIKVFGRKLLKKEGFLIIEHDKKTSFAVSSLYQSTERREFGNTHVTFFTHPSS